MESLGGVGKNMVLGGGFEYFLMFTPMPEKMIQFHLEKTFRWVETTIHLVKLNRDRKHEPKKHQKVAEVSGNLRLFQKNLGW